MIKYPKPVMRMSELEDMGFPREFLECAYRYKSQNFASKINPAKTNSPIIFDTDGFEAFRQKQIKAELLAMPRGGT